MRPVRYLVWLFLTVAIVIQQIRFNGEAAFGFALGLAFGLIWTSYFDDFLDSRYSRRK